MMEEAFFLDKKDGGKIKKTFLMYKFRTMKKGAEKLKKKYLYLNEANGPVFKIREDPRFTHVGSFLAHTGLDELPQFINIIKGKMAFVGPRPLPLDEAKKVPKKYEKRFTVLPGATSTWIVKGAHNLSFDEWMRLDLEYIYKHSLFLDFKVAFLTIFLILKSLAMKLVRKNA